RDPPRRPARRSVEEGRPAGAARAAPARLGRERGTAVDERGRARRRRAAAAFAAEVAMSTKAVGHFTIVNQLGLHARAATKLVQLASRFPCEVEVSRDDQAANGKSVMGVLLL